MVKFTANSDPNLESGEITLNTFDDLNAKDANISNIQTVSLDVSEGINVDGILTASSTNLDVANIGDIKISDNIITLIDGSIYDEIILKADNIQLTSEAATVNLAKVSTSELEITDTLINIARDNISSVQDRGILFDYISGSNTLQGFIGYNPDDSFFRMLTNITDYTNNIAYNRTDNTKYDLGNLELTKLIVNNIENNNESNDINIISENNMNFTSNTGNINMTSNSGEVNIISNSNLIIKSSDINNSVIIGNGLDSKTVINSNFKVEGEFEASTFAFFNSNESIYATKNILLFLDNTVKVDAISETNSGVYEITFNEERTGYSSGNYIYIEGTGDLSSFNGVHEIQTVDSTTNTLLITINFTAGITIPTFSETIYAILGIVTTESSSSGAGISVVTYEENDKTLREPKIHYEFDSNNYKDSSWTVNRNLKIDNTLLLKPQSLYYDNHSGFTRLQVKDDGELYFVNSNDHEYKISNITNDSLIDISPWAISSNSSIYTFNKVVINDSNISDNFELRVNGNVDITGDISSGGDVVFNNADLTGSFSVNGFKSANINTHTLTVKDNNFQIGFYNVLEIDKLYSSADAVFLTHFSEFSSAIDSYLYVRVNIKLETGQIAFFQDCNIYYSSDETNYTTINGMRAIKKIDSKILQIYTDKNANTLIDGSSIKLYRSCVNPPKYVGNNNKSSNTIDNIPFGTDASIYPSDLDPIRIRIFIDSFNGANFTFKYSINSGYSYVNSNIEINSDLSTIYYLSSTSGLSTSDIIDSSTHTELGIKIKFTDISNLSVNDYWEFDCAPDYKSSLDNYGSLIPPTSNNFLGEFGFMLENTNIQDSGFEVMFHDDTNEKTSEKFSFYYTNENDAYWNLTNNIHIMGAIKMEMKDDPCSDNINKGQLIYRNDKKLHFINEDSFDSVLDNDLASQFDISLWNITNDNKVYTYSSVVIADSDISDTYKLKVKGNVQITGKLDAESGDLTANNVDLSGSLSVNGFKSTNLNTQNLTVEDRNFQIGFIDVILIDNINETDKLIKSRIAHKLNSDDYVYFQETNIFFNDTATLRSINGFRKIQVSDTSSLKIFDSENNTYDTSITFKTFNPPRYIGLNNISDSIIDNTSTSYTGTEAVRIRIFMISSSQFKYSLNAGFSYQDDIKTLVDTTTVFNLTDDEESLGISIKFTSIDNLSSGDYWEFDCCPPYILLRDDDGIVIPPTELNFLGEFGKMFPKNELLDAGFEVMMRNPDTFTLESQKFSFFYTNENDAYWKLTANLHTQGSIQMETKIDPPTSEINQGQLIYRDDKKLHFINEDSFDSLLDNDLASQFDISLWNMTNDNKVYSYSSIVIADSDISDTYKLRVKGNVQITGKLDAESGDLTANNVDLSGSLSVNGFKSTNLNTQNLTVEDRNFQIGFIDVILIDNINETDKLIKSRIAHKLNSDDYVYFQETNIFFNDTATLRSINGFRKIQVSDTSSLKIFDSENNTYDTSITFKTFNPPRYIGLNNISDSIIDNTSTSYTGTEAVRIRIFMISSSQFKYSLNAGFSYQDDIKTADTTTNFDLKNNDVSLGISIKFTSIDNLSSGDYWEFDCCPPYILLKDEDGIDIPPTELNFLGEFGKMFPKNELLDAGFEVMMRNPDTFTLESQKFSYFYTNENDAYWKLTANLHTKGSIQMETKINPATSVINQGQLIYRDDKKLHFINEDNFDNILENESFYNFNYDNWTLSNNKDVVYTFNKVGVNLSNPDKQFEVNGEARIRDKLQLDNNLNLNKDSVVLNFGEDSDVNLTHVHNTGLLLNSSMQLQFGEAGEYISGDGTDLSIVSGNSINLDCSGTLNLNSSNGTINLGNDDNDQNINIGTDGERTIAIGADESLKVDINALAIELDGGSNGIIINSADSIDIESSGNLTIDSSGGTIGLGTDNNTGAINIGTSASARTITIGSNDSNEIKLNTISLDVNVGSSGINLDANGSSNFTTSLGSVTIDGKTGVNINENGATIIEIDTNRNINTSNTNQINLDTLSGVYLKTFSTNIGSFTESSSDFVISSLVSDKNIIFKGEDSSSNITALTLDMSEAGAATFNGVVTADAGIKVDNITIDGSEIDLSSGDLTIDVAGDITLDADGGDIFLKDNTTQFIKFTNSNGDCILTNGDSDKDIIFKDTDGNEIVRIDGGEESLILASNKKIMLGATEEFMYGDGTDIHFGVGTDGDINIPVNIGLTFGNDGEKIEGDGTDLTISGNNIKFTGHVIPSTTDTYDIGTSTFKFKDLYSDGVAYIDVLNIAGTSLTTSATELNILDANTSIVGTTTVIDDHGIVMKQGTNTTLTNVQTLAAYLDDEITSMPNLISIGSASSTTNILAGDLEMFNSVNDGNPTFKIGSSSTENLTITTTYDSSAQTLDKVIFSTSVVSNTSNKGKMVFNVDNTDILDIDDDGINFANGMILKHNGNAITDSNSNVLGSAIELQSNKGIENSSGLGIKIEADKGLTVGASGLATVIEANKGLTVGANGLAIDLNADSIATNGKLAMASLAALNNSIVPITNANGEITSSSITNTQLGYLDVSTAGAVESSKAIIVDSNSDISSGLRNINISGSLIFEGTNETAIIVTDPTSDRSINFPDSDGTVCVNADGHLSLDTSGKMTATSGILQNNLVKVSASDVTAGEYAKFTNEGLESKTINEMKSELNLSNVENIALSTATGISNSLANDNTLTVGNSSNVRMTFTPSSTSANDSIAITNTNGTSNSAIEIIASEGGISLDAAAASNFTTRGGALTLEGKTGININEDGSTIIAISNTRGIATTNTNTIDLDCSGTLNLNSTGGIISIGNYNYDQNINIGTNGKRTIAIGADVSTKVDINALEIELDGGTSGIIVNSAATLAIDSTDTTNLRMTSSSVDNKYLTIQAINNDTGSGDIKLFGDSITANNTIFVDASNVVKTTSSDKRLKENIQTIKNGLKIVTQLNPVSYTWKNNEPKAAQNINAYGFIAQDVQKILPNAVLGDDSVNDKYMNYDDRSILAYNTKAIQELKSENDKLKEENKLLKEQLNNILSRLDKAGI